MAAAANQTTASLADKALALLRDEILSGKRSPGSPLSEKVLAAELGMSRTPIRAALKALHQEGLGTVGPRRLLEVTEVTDADRAEIVSLRVAIETVVVERLCEQRAAGQLDADRLDEIRLVVLKQRRAAKKGGAMDFFLLDEQFHLALAALSGMSTAHRFLSELGGFVRLQSIGLPTSVKRMNEILREHEELLNAIEFPDADAAVSLSSHHIRRTARTDSPLELKRT